MVEYEPLLSLNFFSFKWYSVLSNECCIFYSSSIFVWWTTETKVGWCFLSLEWEIAFLKQMLQDPPKDPCPSLPVTLNNASCSTYLPVLFSRENSQSTRSAGLRSLESLYSALGPRSLRGPPCSLCTRTGSTVNTHPWRSLGRAGSQPPSAPVFYRLINVGGTDFLSQHLDTGNLGFISFSKSLNLMWVLTQWNSWQTGLYWESLPSPAPTWGSPRFQKKRVKCHFRHCHHSFLQ